MATRTLVIDGLADSIDGLTILRAPGEAAFTIRAFEVPPEGQCPRRYAEIKVPRYMGEELEALKLSPSTRVRVTVEVMEE